MPEYILHSYQNASLGIVEFGPVEIFAFTTNQTIPPLKIELGKPFHIQNTSKNLSVKIYAYIHYQGLFLKNLCGDVTVALSDLGGKSSWIIKPRPDSTIILTRDISYPAIAAPQKKAEWWESECAQYLADTAKLYDVTFPPNDPKLKRMKLAYYPVHCNSETRPGFTYLYHQPYDIAAYEPWMTHMARISKARRTNDSEHLLAQLERLVTLYAQSATYKPDFVEEFGKQRVDEVFDYLEMTHAGDCDDMAKSIIRAGEILQQGAHKFSDEDGLASLGRLANHFVFCMALVSLAGNGVASLGAGDSAGRVPPEATWR